MCLFCDEFEGENNIAMSGKNRNIKQFRVSNSGNKSEVIESNQDLNNKHVFANITHKNSSGSNNWAIFSKLSLQKNGHQPTRKLMNNKIQDQTPCVSKVDVPSRMCNKPRIGNAGKNRRHFKFSTLREDVPKSNQSNVQGRNLHFSESRSDGSKKLTKHIALDCEMVGVDMGVNKNMLARISLVNSHGNCIYDKFVKPTEPVLDYRTRVSGVRPKDLENGTDFKTVQSEVAEMLKGRILVGHALKHDLRVLYLSHPKHSIRDTSKFHKFREGKTPALKKLAKRYLGVTIQEGEHSSVQDALAAMQLYKMFEKDWESSIYSKKDKIKKSKQKSKQNPLQLIPNQAIVI